MFSAALAIAVVSIMILFCYPPTYFVAMGGPMLVLLLVGCDAIIGPLMTCIVFKRDVKQFRVDLTVIALLQLTALAYGCSIMFAARPAYTIFIVDRFEVVAANEVIGTPGNKPLDPQFASIPLSGPHIIGANLPTDWGERSRLMMSAINGGADAKNLARLYVPYDQVAQIAAAKAKPLSVLARRSVGDEGFAKLIAYDTAPHSSIGFLPLKARAKSLTVVVERPSGRVLDILPIDPW